MLSFMSYTMITAMAAVLVASIWYFFYARAARNKGRGA